MDNDFDLAQCALADRFINDSALFAHRLRLLSHANGLPG